jgi:hypothetical protein
MGNNSVLHVKHEYNISHMRAMFGGIRPIRADQLMGRYFLAALLWLSCSIFHLDAHTLQDPGTLASDAVLAKWRRVIACPMRSLWGTGFCNDPAFNSQGITVALDSPVTRKRLGTHIFASYLDNFPGVNPGLSFLSHFGPQIGNVQIAEASGPGMTPLRPVSISQSFSSSPFVLSGSFARHHPNYGRQRPREVDDRRHRRRRFALMTRPS